MRLSNKTALITGGGSGIGRAIAQRFAVEGARVAVIDLVNERARETVQMLGSQTENDDAWHLAIEADVSNGEQVNAAVRRTLDTFGSLDILVNNAGLSAGDDLRTIDEATWDVNLNVVLKGTYLCAKAVLPAMIEQRRGAIVNVASVNGMMGLGEEAYSAAKAGVINLTQNLAVKYGQFGVRANVICPGTVRTPIWRTQVEETPDIFERLAAWYPLGRVGEADDIANAALFLASDEATWITGTTLPVDGGLTAGSYGMMRALGGA